MTPVDDDSIISEVFGWMAPGEDADMMWMLLAGALVFWMQAGFAMLEAGAVKAPNVQAILFKNVRSTLFFLSCRVAGMYRALVPSPHLPLPLSYALFLFLPKRRDDTRVHSPDDAGFAFPQLHPVPFTLPCTLPTFACAVFVFCVQYISLDPPPPPKTNSL